MNKICRIFSDLKISLTEKFPAREFFLARKIFFMKLLAFAIHNNFCFIYARYSSFNPCGGWFRIPLHSRFHFPLRSRFHGTSNPKDDFPAWKNFSLSLSHFCLIYNSADSFSLLLSQSPAIGVC